MGKLVIDGNSVYEIDEECIRNKEYKRERNNEKQEKNKMKRNNKTGKS